MCPSVPRFKMSWSRRVFVSPTVSCGHLYHASCLGVDTQDAGHLGHSCMVCHKTPTPASGRGRSNTMMVSLSLSCCNSMTVCIVPLQQGQRGRSFTTKRSVSLTSVTSSRGHPSISFSPSLSLFLFALHSCEMRLFWILSRERILGGWICPSRANLTLYVAILIVCTFGA